jgi:hypothetical protein
MEIRTAELTGNQLNFAVAMSLGWKRSETPDFFINPFGYNPDWGVRLPLFSLSWMYAGPIIEQSKIVISPDPANGWSARPYGDKRECYGETPLIAAMRCKVMMRFGNTIDIPDDIKLP